jgi:hypothetical protein
MAIECEKCSAETELVSYCDACGFIERRYQWQDVRERLPKPGTGHVLVYGYDEVNPGPYIGVAEYDGSLGWTSRQEVTHWQLLPHAPPDEICR